MGKERDRWNQNRKTLERRDLLRPGGGGLEGSTERRNPHSHFHITEGENGRRSEGGTDPKTMYPLNLSREEGSYSFNKERRNPLVAIRPKRESQLGRKKPSRSSPLARRKA